MAGKEEDEALAKNYQSDQGETTEDEEVKRNCVMGQSGMNDSDFSDSDFEMEEAEEVEVEVNHGESKKEEDGTSKEDRMECLVKFVSIGSQILKTKGVVLCRPTPIMPTLSVHLGEPEENNDEILNDSKVKSNPHVPATSVAVKSGFSLPVMGSDNETESIAATCSSSSSSDSSDADTDSVESDTQMKATSLDFSLFDGATTITVDTEKGCCESSSSSSADQQETMNGNYYNALIGASGASVDDKWQMAKQKRVLSSNTLFALNQEADRNADTPMKRMRRCCQQQQSFNKDTTSAIPEITLGIEALDQIIQPLPRQYLRRDDSYLILSSSDEEEDKMMSEELEEKFRNSSMGGGSGDNSPIPLLTPPQSPRTVHDTIATMTTIEDRMLSEELEEKFRNSSMGGGSGDNSPIPLLTPPQSPRTVHDTIVEGSTMTTIEWPSNLVMDSAIMKAATTTTTTNAQLEPSSSLAPFLFRSIYVGNT